MTVSVSNMLGNKNDVSQQLARQLQASVNGLVAMVKQEFIPSVLNQAGLAQDFVTSPSLSRSP